MKRRTGALIALLAIVIIGVVVVYLRPREPFQPSTPGEKTVLNVMESDLMALARQESFYYHEHGRFTTHAESTLFLSSLGVSPPKITMRDSGYYAIVTHGSLPGVQCAIAVGTKNPLDRSTKETFPACR
jgi:hypothetical protein